MVSGFTARPAGGAGKKPVPTFSAAVIMYRPVFRSQLRRECWSSSRSPASSGSIRGRPNHGPLPSWRLPATIVLPAAPGIRQGNLMSDDTISPSRDVVLGFNGAWGFAPADLTSPALAAAAGALVDVTLAGAPGP